MGIDEKIADLVRSKKTELPTLPVVVDKILTKAREERTSARDLAELISKDQAIANKLLKLTNSAYYGLMRKVTSISHAITILGFNEVIGLTIGMSVFSAFRQKDLHGLLDMSDLWLHSIGCASAARKVQQKSGSRAAEQIFLNGLLHDMGKVIFAVYFPREYRTVLEEAQESGDLLYHKEKEILGTDHAALSGLLMESWHFHDSIRMPCLFHHDSAECPPAYQSQAMVIEFADFLCQKAEIGHSGNPVLPKSAEIRGKLGISLADADTIVDELKEQRSEIEEFLKLTTESA